MPLRFKLLRRLFDIVNIKLEPRLRRRNFVGPGILTKAGLCDLPKRPECESLCAFQNRAEGDDAVKIGFWTSD
jgi:hypothetical protein